MRSFLRFRIRIVNVGSFGMAREWAFSPYDEAASLADWRPTK
jgi:hypothetical protein